MAIDVTSLKAKADIVSVIGAHVALKKRGAEYVGLCPFHADKNPSFWVSPGKQFAHCFACDAHHDVISFLQEIEGLDFKAACERLGAVDKWEPAPAAQRKQERKPERVTSKPPEDAPAPSMAIQKLGGEPELIFPIRDLDGAILGYECRYKGDGKKEIRVWTWGHTGDSSPRWACGHFNAPRPLYGLPRLIERPDAPVSIFEGPKKAEAGKRLLPAYACISWTGGANAWHKHDWSPVRGRKLLLWPDADEAGWTACEKLAALLSDPKGLACSVRVVDTNRMPEGWDVADAEAEGWDTVQLVEWAKPRARDYQPPLPPEPEPPPPDDDQPPVEAYADEPAAQQKKRKPRLQVVGNTALAPEPDAEPLPAAMSEDALADHFAETYGQDWRHVREWGQWFKWSGDSWAEDRTAEAEHLSVQVTREALYWAEAQALTPKEKRQISKKSTAWAIRDLAGIDRRIAATVDQWNRDPLLLGVPGGVVDLRTGAMLEPVREQYISKKTAVAPASGKPVKWLEYMNRVHDGIDSVIGYLQRYAGYCCTGDTKEHALAFLYGTGRNGKGVFLETVSRILGDYARTASIDTFMEKAQSAHSTELARLHGARLVITEEAASGGRWNEARIKHITGGGKITAHFMRQDDFEYTPTFKLLIAANHKPMLRSVDEAIKARIHLVPFRVTIPPEERDKDLLLKLEAEWPQILGWMLDGCAEWQRNGLQVPAEISEATDQYVEAEDVLGQWIEECCERAHEAEGASLYQSYSQWCDKQGERQHSRRAWSNELIERGFAQRKSMGRRLFVGVSLKNSGGPPSSYEIP